MKGQTLVIAIVLFVLLVVGAIYFAMTATINKIKEEDHEKSVSVVASYEIDSMTVFFK